MATSLATVRRIARELPGVEEGTSYGTAAFRVRKKFFARMLEDGETLVVKVGDEERDALLAGDPKTFFVTDHYRGHPMMLVRLARVREATLAQVLERAWRNAAPASLVRDRDTAGSRAR